MMIVLGFLLTMAPVLSLLVNEHSPTKCKEGWVQYKNTCYMFSVATENWFNAELFCRAVEGRLAEIHSNDVNDFLKNHLKVQHFGATNPRDIRYWIGLTDIAHATRWIWEHGGNAPEFTDWGTGQPEKNTEHCGFLFGADTFKWHDMDCDGKAFFICQSILT